MRRIVSSVLAAFTIIALSIFGVQQASATAAVVNTCYSGHATGEWDHYHTYAYLSHLSAPGTGPTWCISNAANNDRLVWQSDGNLVAYAGVHSGGPALWSSHTQGRGSQLRFQGNDGNLVIYQYPMVPIWAAGAWGTCSNAGFSLSLNYRSAEDWSVAACLFQHDGQKLIASWAR